MRQVNSSKQGRPTTGWEKTISICSGRDYLFTIENSGYLYRINPNDGSWETFGEKLFKKTKCMIHMKNEIYV